MIDDRAIRRMFWETAAQGAGVLAWLAVMALACWGVCWALDAEEEAVRAGRKDARTAVLPVLEEDASGDESEDPGEGR